MALFHECGPSQVGTGEKGSHLLAKQLVVGFHFADQAFELGELCLNIFKYRQLLALVAQAVNLLYILPAVAQLVLIAAIGNQQDVLEGPVVDKFRVDEVAVDFIKTIVRTADLSLIGEPDHGIVTVPNLIDVLEDFLDLIDFFDLRACFDGGAH